MKTNKSNIPVVLKVRADAFERAMLTERDRADSAEKYLKQVNTRLRQMRVRAHDAEQRVDEEQRMREAHYMRIWEERRRVEAAERKIEKLKERCVRVEEERDTLATAEQRVRDLERHSELLLAECKTYKDKRDTAVEALRPYANPDTYPDGEEDRANLARQVLLEIEADTPNDLNPVCSCPFKKSGYPTDLACPVHGVMGSESADTYPEVENDNNS